MKTKLCLTVMLATLATVGLALAPVGVDQVSANHSASQICESRISGGQDSPSYVPCLNQLTADFAACDALADPVAWEPCKDGAVDAYFGVPDPDDPDDPDDGSGAGDAGSLITDDLTLEEPGTLDVADVEVGCASEGVGSGNNELLCELIRYTNFLSLGVVVVAAITIAVSGIQYTTSRGEPAKAAQAVSRIVTVAMGLLVYVFGWAFLNWLIPGGAL